MRNLALLLSLAVFCLPSFAARRITAEKLEQELAASNGIPDAKLAQRIYQLELTERLSGSRLARLETDTPGPLARLALIAIADASEFLDLPAGEIPVLAAPDPAAQNSMLARTADYVRRTIPKLPDLFATQDTTRFEDTPMGPELNSGPAKTYEPLHEVGKSSATVLYRNESEVTRVEIPQAGKHGKSRSKERELSTRGVFGPILSTVLGDSAKG